MNERKLELIIKSVVACAVVLLFTMLVTLTVQFSVKMNQRAMLRTLNATHAELEHALKYETEVEQHMRGERYIDEYAAMELNYGREGTKIFK